jgi:hypothetical protein
MSTALYVKRNNGDSGTATPQSSEFSPNVHVYKDDQQLGTFSLEQIQTLLQEGILVAGDLAWVEGSESYIAVENVAGIMAGSGEPFRRVVSHEK